MNYLPALASLQAWITGSGFALNGNLLIALTWVSCSVTHPLPANKVVDMDPQSGFLAQPPTGAHEQAIGERAFGDERFSQAFWAFAKGRGGLGIPHPAPEGLISCASCHHMGGPNGKRSMADFGIRSPIPRRTEDGLDSTLRNTPSLMGATIRDGSRLHFDGQFGSANELVRGTFLGRNHGWLPWESELAKSHVAHVLKSDKGRNVGLTYGQALATSVFRVDMEHDSDDRLLEALAQCVAAYLNTLDFARDETGAHSGSAYDQFLALNGISRKPSPGQADNGYSAELLRVLDGGNSTFDLLPGFGRLELNGLKVFLRTPGPDPVRPNARGIGNCAECHPPPSFTDYAFHNTGASSDEYDERHAYGDFLALEIPSQEQRLRNPDDLLPASSSHPQARGTFAATPHVDFPSRVDLGLWNVLLNPDQAATQRNLHATFMQQVQAEAMHKPNANSLLEASIARFKTPGLRNLLNSDPYFHNGVATDLQQVVHFYWNASLTVRSSLERNMAPAMADIYLSKQDRKALVAFLISLTEL